jgi:AraC-like DNA-binding protein/quercetin dioxygenase-like cupin family protein
MLYCMAVSAQSAINAPGAARVGRTDVRGTSGVLAGTFPFEAGDETVTGWHFHDLHQLEYAFQGVAQVETATARYLLPPQQAVWIPAGVEHCTTLTRVKTMSVFFDPAMGLAAGNRVRILAVPPVIREMILYAGRWPIRRAWSDPAADAFLAVLAVLIAEQLDHETPLCLPTTGDPLVAAAMRYTTDHLEDVSMSQVCTAVGASERTLRRAFASAAGMPWRRYVLESRLLAAMALLSEPGPTVLAISAAVGFQSVSAFTRAFRRYTGEAPAAYRRRVTQGAAGG